MPFDNTGLYTPPAGATSAVPGQTIASATWNSIFSDIATAMTQLAREQIIRTPRIITVAGDIAVAVADRIILIGASVPNITLPASATKTCPVTIIGNAAGIFSANNSTLVPNGLETIDGLAANPVLTNDFQSITLLPLSSGGWRIM